MDLYSIISLTASIFSIISGLFSKSKEIKLMLISIGLVLLVILVSGFSKEMGPEPTTPTGPGEDLHTSVGVTENENITENEKVKLPKVGDVITFGEYEQDNNFSNGAEPVEWRVLDSDETGILVVSLYGLDSEKYHPQETDISWSQCHVRQWLNTSFFSSAFSQEEQAQIRKTNVLAHKNPKYRSVNPGSDTMDNVFLLSLEELQQYYSNSVDRLCVPTTYARMEGAYRNPKTDGGWWLLRTPGMDLSHVACVNSDGEIDAGSTRVNGINGMIRPAIWIDFNEKKESLL